MSACSQPTGYVSDATDCNDVSPAIYLVLRSTATHLTMTGLIDDGGPIGAQSYYNDTDGDGWRPSNADHVAPPSSNDSGPRLQ